MKFTFTILFSFATSIFSYAQVVSLDTTIIKVDTLIKPTKRVLQRSSLVETPNENSNFVPNVVPPSPTAASLNKFIDIPISNYNGTPDVSVPLYRISENSLSVPITLGYHPSGIKVAEEASQVGLGWAISVGGAVSRTVVGEDDFSYGYFSLLNNLNNQYVPLSNVQVGQIVSGNGSVHQFGFMDATFNSQNLQLKTEQGTFKEYQPDMFTFSYPGGGGKFIITRDKQIIIKDKTDIIVNMIEGSVMGAYDGFNISFEVITPDGTKYLYDEKEVYSIPSSGNTANHVSSWYLKKITSQTNDEINFVYNKSTLGKNYAIGDISQTNVVSIIGSSCASIDESGNPTGTHNSTPPTRNPPKYIETVYLSKVNFTNGFVDFLYGTREDLNWDKKLENVKVFSYSSEGNNLIKNYALNYSYFNGSVDNEGFGGTEDGSNIKRLKLISVAEVTADQGQILLGSYVYFEDEIFSLPAKTSFAIDHWGFFNGQTASSSLIPTYTNFPTTDQVLYYYGIQTGTERNTFPYYARAFSLKRINYATGGYTDFEFESNEYDVAKSKLKDFSYSRNIPLVNLVIEGKDYITSSMGTEQQFLINLNNMVESSLGSGSILDINAFVRFPSSINCGYANQSNLVTFELVNQATNASIIFTDMITTNTCISPNTTGCATRLCPSMEGIQYNTKVTISPGIYILKAKATNGTDFTVQDYKFTFKWYEAKTVVPGAKEYAGGLRIKKILTFDGEKSIVKSFNYSTSELENGVAVEKSSGRLMTLPQYTYYESKACIQNNGIGGLQGKGYGIINRTSNSITPLNASASGAFVGYDKVTVTYGENGENGKSEYFYDNQSDKVENFSFYRPPIISSLPYSGNGLLLKQIDYKKTSSGFFKVKEIINTYYTSQNFSSLQLYKFKYGVELRPLPIFLSGAIAYSNNHGFFYPAIIEEIKYNLTSIEKVYDLNDVSNSISLNTSTSNTYNYQVYNSVTNSFSKTYMQPTKSESINSKNQTLTTTIKYPYDFSGNIIYDEMVTKNIVSSPIEEMSLLNNSQVSKKVINIQKTNGFFVPLNIQTQRGSLDPLFTEVVFNNYDSKGKPTLFTEKNGIQTNIVYYGNLDLGKVFLTKSKTVGTGLLAQTTTFDYFPLIGLKEMVQPNGIKMTYEYDSFNRLKAIRDTNGKLIKSNTYNYKTGQ